MDSENVRIIYDVQIDPDIFDLLLKNNVAHSFSFSSDQFIAFDENETIFLQIGDEWFDARINKIKKGIEFGREPQTGVSSPMRSQLSVLIDAVFLDRDRLVAYIKSSITNK